MKEGTTRTVLDLTPSSMAQKLVEIYKRDPKEARIIYMNAGTKIIEKSLILWEDANGDWDISQTEKTFGISITNKMYSRFTKTSSIIYKAGKFYQRFKGMGGTKFAQLTWGAFMTFIRGNNNPALREFLERLLKRVTWLRFIEENPVFHSVALNTFVRYKLYNRNKALKHILKVPLPAALKLIGAIHEKGNLERLPKEWKALSKMVTNVENLRVELLSNHLFVDSCRMAHIVGEKINLAWSDARLKEEHDKYTKLITNTIYANIDEKPLRIRQEYINFCEKYGFTLLKSNKDLYIEGFTQRHCVGTYEYDVNRGNCAIFHHEGYTGELRYTEADYERMVIRTIGEPENEELVCVKPPSIRLNQFRGFNNKNAPRELNEYVNEKIRDFNEHLITAKASVVEKNITPMNKAEWFMNAGNRTFFNIFQKPINGVTEAPTALEDVDGDVDWGDVAEGVPMENWGNEVMREH
jgi:hypothetical protein